MASIVGRAWRRIRGTCKAHLDIDASFGPQIRFRVYSDQRQRRLTTGARDRLEREARAALPSHRRESPAVEAALIEHDLKWSPVKVYEKTFRRGVGPCSSNWRLFVEYLTRAGETMPDEGVPFTAIVTISEYQSPTSLFSPTCGKAFRQSERRSRISGPPLGLQHVFSASIKSAVMHALAGSTPGFDVPNWYAYPSRWLISEFCSRSLCWPLLTTRLEVLNCRQLRLHRSLFSDAAKRRFAWQYLQERARGALDIRRLTSSSTQPSNPASTRTASMGTTAPSARPYRPKPMTDLSP